MAELEAAHKAKQQGVTRWREAREFVNLLELADAVDIQTAQCLQHSTPSGWLQ